MLNRRVKKIVSDLHTFREAEDDVELKMTRLSREKSNPLNNNTYIIWNSGSDSFQAKFIIHHLNAYKIKSLFVKKRPSRHRRLTSRVILPLPTFRWVSEKNSIFFRWIVESNDWKLLKFLLQFLSWYRQCKLRDLWCNRVINTNWPTTNNVVCRMGSWVHGTFELELISVRVDVEIWFYFSKISAMNNQHVHRHVAAWNSFIGIECLISLLLFSVAVDAISRNIAKCQKWNENLIRWENFSNFLISSLYAVKLGSNIEYRMWTKMSFMSAWHHTRLYIPSTKSELKASQIISQQSNDDRHATAVSKCYWTWYQKPRSGRTTWRKASNHFSLISTFNPKWLDKRERGDEASEKRREKLINFMQILNHVCRRNLSKQFFLLLFIVQLDTCLLAKLRLEKLEICVPWRTKKYEYK